MEVIILRNGNDIFDYAHRYRLENALSLKRPLMIAYYLKEDLKEIWNQCSKQKAKAVLDEWVKQAIESKNTAIGENGINYLSIQDIHFSMV